MGAACVRGRLVGACATAAALHAIFRAAPMSRARGMATACAPFALACQDFDGAILLDEVTLARLT